MTTATVHDRRRYGATDPKRRTIGWIIVAVMKGNNLNVDNNQL